MQSSSSLARVLACVPVLLLLALALIPATRWLVISNLRAQFSLASPGSERTLVEKAARRHPGDAGAALGAILYRERITGPEDKAAEAREADAQLERLHALLLQFPDRPILYAHALRLMSLARVKLRRNEYDQLTGKPVPPEAPLTTKELADLAEFEALAAQGERLDADNSFFPAMRMVGLLALHRDKEALSALHRAAERPHWRAYVADGIRATQRLEEEANGQRSGIFRVSSMLSTLYPHFVALRQAVRTVAALAVASETAGNRPGGLSMRHDAMRLGTQLRFEEPSAIGSLVGVALTSIAAMRPGGERAPAEEAQLSAEERRQRTTDRYRRYLEGQGFRQEAEWYRTEADAGWRIKQFLDRAADLSPINTSVPGIVTLSVICTVLLSNVLVLLLFVPLSQIRAPAAYRTLLLVAIALWQWRVATLWGTSFFKWINLFEDKPVPIPNALAYTSFVPFCMASLFIAGAIAAFQRRRRRDLVSPDARPPLMPYLVGANAFCLLYLIAISCSVVQENRLRIAIDKTITHEGRYFAELVHKPWPGAAP